ncbi:hypothetical protein ACFLW1_02645, partial [Chloroflexota bacterium]
AVQDWGRRDCQKALGEVDKYVSPSYVDRCISYFIRGNRTSDLEYPFEVLEDRYKTSQDFSFLIENINEFIKIGFNRKADIASGNLKVIPSHDYMLFHAVFLGSLAFYFEGTDDYEKSKIIEFMGKSLDVSRIYKGTSKNRLHRWRTKSFGNLNWKRRSDKKIRVKAELWYQSRVVHESLEAFCIKQQLKGENNTSDNLVKEILPCDIATGYPRKNLPDQSIT